MIVRRRNIIGVGSVIYRNRYEDPDQNETDPQHWSFKGGGTIIDQISVTQTHEQDEVHRSVSAKGKAKFEFKDKVYSR